MCVGTALLGWGLGPKGMCSGHPSLCILCGLSMAGRKHPTHRAPCACVTLCADAKVSGCLCQSLRGCVDKQEAQFWNIWSAQGTPRYCPVKTCLEPWAPRQPPCPSFEPGPWQGRGEGLPNSPNTVAPGLGGDPLACSLELCI